MTIDDFVRIYNLKPGDVFRLSKTAAGLSRQKIVYLGFTGIEHKFLADIKGRGIDWLTRKELLILSRLYVPLNIQKFQGSIHARTPITLRAVRSMKKHAYHLLTFNQQELANYVRTGHPSASKREKKMLGVGVATTSAILAASSKNKAVQAFGIFATFAALAATISLSKEDE